MNQLRTALMAGCLVVLLASCQTPTQSQLPKEKQVSVEGFNTSLKFGGVKYDQPFIPGEINEMPGALRNSYTITLSSFKLKDPQKKYAVLYLQMELSSTTDCYYLYGITLNQGNVKYHPTVLAYYSPGNPSRHVFSREKDLAFKPDQPGLYTFELGYPYSPPARFDSIGLCGATYAQHADNGQIKEIVEKAQTRQKAVALDDHDTRVGWRYYEKPEGW